MVNSFIYIIDNNGKERRLSNGPMEGYNRTPKDFKRNSRGLSNFEYARSRLIRANRPNEPILSTPKSKQEVYKYKK
ncbi:transposase [Candidatus Stoquefichus sp. SB1]|uniref:transposase n=1 Tax=Candidatus Stoquefichus sp. SB1 TaxID=1658109 RepID=UPI00403D6C98